jgi:hypothetical protein
MGKVQFNDNVKDEEKENLLKSLKEIIEAAQAAQAKLSQ